MGVLAGLLSSVGCVTQGEPGDPWVNGDLDSSAREDESGRAPSVLASTELFDLASRWASDAPKPAGVRGMAGAAGTDLVTYAQQHAPGLAEEARAALQLMNASTSSAVAIQSGCVCSVWGNFVASAGSQSGSSWTLSSRGAAHDAHIYQAVSGSTSERTAFPAPTSTKFRTRIVCTTPEGAACSAGCSAQLYADAYYSTRMYAEAHVWTIWNRAGTTQVADGATLDLRIPYGGSQRLAEKLGSVKHYTNGGDYNPNDIINVVKGALAIYLAIQSGGTASSIVGSLNAETVRGLLGLINSGTSNNNGSYEAAMKMEFESYFDAQPILLNYQSDTNQVYGLDLTSSASMKVRGYGYHSETGDLKSSYALAAYIDNFSCASGVTPPQRTGFWSYDGYAGAPLSLANLRSELASFFYLGYGAYPDLSASSGTLVQGVCGNARCEALESPSNCAADCGYCGDSACNPVFESSSTCNSDCGYCGDSICGGGEDQWSCNYDCGYCGDGLCGGSEDQWSCNYDCGYCGDGICGGSEDQWSCSYDCYCGGGICPVSEKM